jgi:PKD repeat protein
MDYDVLCSGKTGTFFDQSTVSQGDVIQADWLFDNQAFASGAVAGYVFPDVGSYPVRLVVTTEGGCRDTTWQSVTVNGSPISAFNADWVCLGEPTLFQATPDVSASGPIQSYLWDFEGQSSIFQSTTYTWLNAGPHQVSLTVTSTLGCSDDTLMDVLVSLDPIGAFLDNANCFGEAIQFSDASITSFGDQIVHWDWFFGAQGASNQASPSFQFSAPGTYNVALNVVSAAGCEDQVDRLVTIHPLPQAEFSVFPEIGEPPFTPEITNLSSGANTYLWSLDLGQESVDFEPNHIFTDSGLVFIDLQVTNQFGCTDETTGSILLTELLTDLVLLDLAYSENGDFINPVLTVSNLSNYRVNSFTIHAEITNGTVLQESYAIPIEAGETRVIQMSSSLFYRDGADLPYICVNLSPKAGRTDLDMSNNALCKLIGTGTSDIFWLDPRPNPVHSLMTFGHANAAKGPLLASVYDAMGRQVMEFEYSAGLSLVERYTIDVSGIEPGRYVLRLVKGIHEKVYQFQVLKD